MLRVCWWSRPHNFGDVLTPHVLDHFGIDYVRVPHDEAEVLVVGSIARLAKPGMTVLGSGIIRRDEALSPGVEWKFVRGPLTADAVRRQGGECPDFYGDPALLLPLILDRPKVSHKVGLVPHYQDYRPLHQKYHRDMPVIDVDNRNALATAWQIASCEKIISTSLHGIIAAHAYGIPAAYVEVSQLWGDGVKFEDYYASVGLEPELSTVERPKFSVGIVPDLDPICEVFESLGDV